MVGAKTGRLNGREAECRGPLPPGPFSASSTVNTHTHTETGKRPPGAHCDYHRWTLDSPSTAHQLLLVIIPREAIAGYPAAAKSYTHVHKQ